MKTDDAAALDLCPKTLAYFPHTIQARATIQPVTAVGLPGATETVSLLDQVLLQTDVMI